MIPSLIILNGTSSSGKTSLSKELLKLIKIPVMHFSLDMYMDMLPKNLPRKDFISVFPKVYSGYVDSIIASHDHGLAIIADTVFEIAEELNMYASKLADLHAYLIRVDCDLQELEKRELSRGDRRVGHAKGHLELMANYSSVCDFKVDTTDISPLEGANKLLQFLEEKKEPTAFSEILLEDSNRS